MLAIFYDTGYSPEFFETTNVRSVGTANLWASIGGQIGMIMGLSFFQVPDIVSGIFNYVQRKRMCRKYCCNSQTSTVGTETLGNQD